MKCLAEFERRRRELPLDFGLKFCLLKFQTENQGVKVLE